MNSGIQTTIGLIDDNKDFARYFEIWLRSWAEELSGNIQFEHFNPDLTYDDGIDVMNPSFEEIFDKLKQRTAQRIILLIDADFLSGLYYEL